MSMTYWYHKSLVWFLRFFLPVEWLYRLIVYLRSKAYATGWLKTHKLPIPVWVGLIVYLRSKAYATGWLKTHKLPIPVWVVGNVTVGGTGKTPLVIAIVQWLKKQGLQPGIVSRGYGAQQKHFPHKVKLTDTAQQVGDEPLLIAQQTQCPVVIDPNRVRGACKLVNLGVDIIVADDGFQHHSLHRDCNILVVDGARRYGNGHCLPLGPLREPLSALMRAHFIVCNGAPAQENEYFMTLEPQSLMPLGEDGETIINKNQPIHAVAAIGHPQRFFTLLEEQGYTIIPHIFPDHHGFVPSDLAFGDNYPVVMTPKDAIKCATFSQPHWWVLPITAILDDAFWQQLDLLLP